MTEAAPTVFDSGLAEIHSLTRGVLFLSLVLSSVSVFSASTAQNISGRIVAYSEPLTCLNGNAYWSMIIHVHDGKVVRSEFLRVNFSLSCSESPKWLLEKSSDRKFRLIRDKVSDEVLAEFIECTEKSATNQQPKTCPPIPVWRHPPGAEDVKLPYGQVVPAYRSVDLPLAPVV